MPIRRGAKIQAGGYEPLRFAPWYRASVGRTRPNEEIDLADRHPEVVEELQAALDAFPKTESSWSAPKPWELDLLFGGEETGPPIAESASRD